ncbi:MAG: mechanosensitive ion channel family protein [Novosphingobium sp.]
MSFRQRLIEAVQWLDGLGFDVGSYRISLYRALLIAIVAVVVLIAGRVASALIRRFFRRMSRLDPAQQLLGEKLTSLLAWIGLVLIGIDFLGISLTALTVFSGAMGLAIGFGLQKTFGNLISGIILLMDRSIKPGDVIAVHDGVKHTVGQVTRIGIRAVSVVTRDKIEFLIPNEVLMTSQVENWSFSSRDVRVKVPVAVSYGCDIELAERLMLEEVRKLPRVLPTRQPSVWLTAFGDNAFLFEIQLWIDDPEDGLGDLRSDLLKALWKRFKENGIEVPFPQREVRIKGLPLGDAPSAPKVPSN